MASMTITDESWTIDGATAAWIAEDFGDVVAKASANMQLAWLLDQIGARLDGWDFDRFSGRFHGPARADALDVVTELVAESKARITG